MSVKYSFFGGLGKHILIRHRGKTLEMIALIVSDGQYSTVKPGPTLIIAPVGVMSNWSGQVSRFRMRA